MRVLVSSVFFILFANAAQCLRILGIFAYPGYSHFEFFKPLMDGLVKRGHTVTLISPFPLSASPGDYTHVDTKDVVKQQLGNLDLTEQRSRLRVHNSVARLAGYTLDFCNQTISSTVYKDFLEQENNFDLILAEFFGSNCYLLSAHLKHKAPIIGVQSHVMMPWTNPWIGNPDNPAYIPSLFMNFHDKMDFLERVENTIAWLYNNFYYKSIAMCDDCEAVRKLYGSCGDHAGVLNNISLMLVNAHFTLNRPRPLAPAVVDVSGLHIGEPKHPPEVCDR